MKNAQSESVRISASIHKNTKLRKNALPLIIRYFIVLCGCCGSVFAFLTCFDFNISNVLVFAVIAVSCAVFTVIFSLNSKYLRNCIILCLAAFISAAFFLREKICAGLANVLNIYLARIKQEYAETPFIIIAEPKLSEQHILVFLMFTVIMMCFGVAYCAVKKSSATGVCLFTFIPFIAVLMFGLEPHPAAFASIIICWVSMLSLEISMSGRLSEERFRRYSAYCGMTTAVIAAVCFTVIISAAKIFDYKRPEKLDEIFDKTVEYIQNGGVQKTFDDIVTIVTKNPSSSGAINHGKLGQFDEISFEGKTVLQVTIPKSEETIYLRGYVGAVYTGNTWEELSASKLNELEKITANFETSGLTPLLLDSYNLKYTPTSMPHYSFTVKNVSANGDYLYLPYNLVPESISRYETINNSTFYSPDKTYIGQFYNPKEYYGYQNIFRKRWSIPSALVNDEAVYRQFVYENYLDIPESFVPTEIFNQNYYDYITAEEIKTGKSTLDEMTVLSRKLYYIKEWLRDNCEYSLKAGKLPTGEDFVNYFLENRKGSCSYFASAAAIMCRYAGIPARYVEGYIIKPADFPAGDAVGTISTIDVTDARGHAWVEVYLDGFGWYPVEFTSGYGNVRTSRPTETVTETELLQSETQVSASAENTDETEPIQQETSPQPQDNETAQTNLSDTTEQHAETTVPVQEAETETQQISESDNSGSNSVGFGFFGIKGSKQVDKWYDLTWILVVILVIAAVPAVMVLRRNIILARRRRNALDDIGAGVLEDYRRFEKLLMLMKMPSRGGMDYSEYAETLSRHSPLFAEKTAEVIIDTALKASFGGGSLTHNEAQEMRLAVNSLAKRYCNTLSRFGKFKLKYVYCIL